MPIESCGPSSVRIGAKMTNASIISASMLENIDFRSADTLLKQIVLQMNQQAHEIQALKDDAKENASSELISSLRQECLVQFRDMGKRLENIERAVFLDPGRNGAGRKVPILRVLEDHSAAIESLQRSTSKNVNLELLDKELCRLEKHVEACMNKEREKYTTAVQMSKLRESQENLYAQLTAMSRVIDCKLDKAEVSNLQTSLLWLNSYDGQIREIKESLETVHEKLETSKVKLSEHDTDLKTFREKLLDLGNALNHMRESTIQKFDDQKSILKKDILNISVSCQETKNCLEESLPRIQRKFHVGLQSALHSLKTTESQILAITASKEEVNEKVSWKRFHEVQKEISKEMNCKAWKKGLEDMEKLMGQVIAWKTEISKEVDLATRFIAWFSSRGEAYEHNLGVIHSQLRQLSKQSAREKREPFDR